jgi:hypothetical protein
MARRLYANEPFGVELKDTVYALDATTIGLCLSVFPWPPFRSTKAAIKRHTLLDLKGSIRSFIHISDGKWHEVNLLDELIAEPGAFYVMDRVVFQVDQSVSKRSALPKTPSKPKSGSRSPSTSSWPS